jgi:Raf kinase inhibitor-like YbhB/YbcL family protein
MSQFQCVLKHIFIIVYIHKLIIIIMGFEISSPAFENGAKIPIVHSCNGEDVSPLLRWEGEPKGTVTFALIMEDPDAPGGTFTHWIVYNLPADCHELEKIIPIKKNLTIRPSREKMISGKRVIADHVPRKAKNTDIFSEYTP